MESWKKVSMVVPRESGVESSWGDCCRGLAAWKVDGGGKMSGYLSTKYCSWRKMNFGRRGIMLGLLAAALQRTITRPTSAIVPLISS